MKKLFVMFALSFLGCSANASANSMWQLWQQGNISAAKKSAQRFLQVDADQARHVLMLTAFARGKFQEAIDQQQLISNSYSRFQDTLMPVIDAYRHLGQYSEAYAFAVNHSVNEPVGLQDALKQYSVSPPKFQLAKATEIPFKMNDPFNPYLPGFDLTLNGRTMIGHIDTGGTFVVISKELADQMGLKYTYFGNGHCNGKEASVWFTQTTMQLGDLLVTGIPTEISDCLDGTAMKARAIFGTNILQRFLSTIDYPKNRLVLSPFTQRSAHARLVSTGYSSSTKQKFHIWGDHYMFAKGQMSGFKNRNFFVDTGLVTFHADGRQSAFLTSTKNLIDMGYDQQTLANDNVVNIIGDVGFKRIVQSGHAVQHQGVISFSNFGGVEITGLIGHAFLNKYSWTIDFEKMSYTFRQ
ncbi:MAG: retroviral-like aspartic protease family protein [Bdellovibrionales bacterium]